MVTRRLDVVMLLQLLPNNVGPIRKGARDFARQVCANLLGRRTILQGLMHAILRG